VASPNRPKLGHGRIPVDYLLEKSDRLTYFGLACRVSSAVLPSTRGPGFPTTGHGLEPPALLRRDLDTDPPRDCRTSSDRSASRRSSSQLSVFRCRSLSASIAEP
jgi:hypothetical protein